MIVLSAIYALGYQPATDDPYGVSLTAAGTVTLGFVAPVCAALAAWEGGRLRRADWWTLPHVRPLAMVAGALLAPVIVAGMLAVFAAIIVEFAKGGLLAVPDLRLVVLSLFVSGGHAMVGFAVGLRVPVVVAAPSVLVASYLWMAFPRAMEPLWLRHLNGSLSSCCLPQDDLALSAVLAAAMVALGMVAAGGVLIALRGRWRNVVIGLGVLVASFGLAIPLVSGLGPDPVVARNPDSLVCRASSGVTVCVWPEHGERLEEVAGITTRAVERWRAVGLSVPSSYREARVTDADPETSGFGFSRHSSQADILHALAYGLLPAWPACAETGAYPGFDARDPLHAWYDATGGMSKADLEQRFPPSGVPGDPAPLEILNRLSAATPEERADWLADNLAAVASCDREPQLLPP
ncbi:MAG TPA: hypothetical protein VFH63_03605 [candidate division Zixibacteria bacterium]|nr:hypothetical protein [candidate division Zixibacteria bacterium]